VLTRDSLPFDDAAENHINKSKNVKKKTQQVTNKLNKRFGVVAVADIVIVVVDALDDDVCCVFDRLVGDAST
jgi:hypothetical protein